jgi:hypothetical protein
MVSTSLFEAVPIRFVHKLAAGEVLLDGWRRTGESSCLVAAKWPRTHDYYAGPDGRRHPMLLIESVRQCLPLVSHAVFDVPLEHHLVWESFGCRTVPSALDADSPRDGVEIHVHCDDVRMRGTRVAALALSLAVRRGDAELATAWTRFTIQAPGVYRRVRGEAACRSSAVGRPATLPPPVHPVSVGRRLESDVLLSATDRPRVWRLRVDTRHPIFFDHPVDHVPGALLLDAALQAAHAGTHQPDRPGLPSRPVRSVEIDCHFGQFVEIDDPCRIEAQPLPVAYAGHEPVKVVIRRQGTQPGAEPAFVSVVTLDRGAQPGGARSYSR